MVKQKWFAVFVLVALLLSAALPPVVAQETAPTSLSSRGIDDPYQFPIVPGSPTWQTFTTHQEMLDATRIPDEVLGSMSTVALIRTAMDYPLLFDMYLYSNTQQEFVM